jgi:prolyl-tRNA synthetase
LSEGLEAESGFWTGTWCGDEACEKKVTAETKATIRVLPIQREDPGAGCVVCGKPGAERATWARAY